MNKKSLILNFIIAVLCGLTFVFLAFPALNETTGYQMLEVMQESLYIAMPIIFLMGLIGLLFIATVLSILGDLNVIKNNKFNSVVRIISKVLAILVLYTYGLVMAEVFTMEFVAKSLGWGSIVNIVIDIALAVLVLINNCKRK